MMQSNVGIIRTASEIDEAIVELEKFSERVQNIAIKGGRAYNPGWNLATDLPSMLSVSKCTARGARERKESRGGHTREDFPKASAEFGKVNFAHSLPQGANWHDEISTNPVPVMTVPAELQALLEEAK